MKTLLRLDPATYRPHMLHSNARTFPESNCYSDVIIELLHAQGFEPLAAMGTCVRSDFEGDQWTFFKPDSASLERLFGIDIHEMACYRPLWIHLEELIDRGFTAIIECDSWYLPDTATISYRRDHVKTSIVIEAIDSRRERLRYFHGRSLYELGGEDYQGVVGNIGDVPGWWFPYVELVRFDRLVRRPGMELLDLAKTIFAANLARRPAENPFVRFGARLAQDLPRLMSQDIEEYHKYAFATVRMAGAGFEVCGAHVEWLYGAEAHVAVAALERIVAGTKKLLLKMARRRPFDCAGVVAELAAAWDEAMTAMVALAR